MTSKDDTCPYIRLVILGDSCYYQYYSSVYSTIRYGYKYCSSCCGSYGSQYCCSLSYFYYTTSAGVVAGAVMGAVFGAILLCAAVVLCVKLFMKNTRQVNTPRGVFSVSGPRRTTTDTHMVSQNPAAVQSQQTSRMIQLMPYSSSQVTPSVYPPQTVDCVYSPPPPYQMPAVGGMGGNLYPSEPPSYDAVSKRDYRFSADKRF